MRKLLLATVFQLSIVAAAYAQAPSVAQMGVLTTPLPEVLQVLDTNKHWVSIGSFQPGGAFQVQNFPLIGAPGIIPDGYWGSADATYTSAGTVLTSAARACTTA